MSETDQRCEVCNDIGTYPVINRYGQTLYDINCPECQGNSERIIWVDPPVQQTP